ncbi:MAG TPA: alpha-L-rhamnosidase C-terminal domain-containing protein [Agromyces mariniharenae]|nr:alpha-L-rhamnosidase C-terminal domain-containing protein [Agromyces mariniharenae]
MRDRSPQPFADDDVVPPPGGTAWLYGPGQYELALLARLVDEGFAANRHVHYPRNHGRVADRVAFTATATDAATARLRIAGSLVSAALDGQVVEASVVAPDGNGGGSVVELALPRVGTELRLDLVASEGHVPAVAVDPGAPLRGWRASVDDGPGKEVRPRPGGDVPPHEAPVGTVEVVARGMRDGLDGEGALYDVGAPVLGRPVLPPGPRPVVSSGESLAEALADPEAHETRHDVVELPDGGWTTRHPLGFRYLVVRSDAPPESVAAHASVPVVERPGAFACSDEELTRIWAAAQYTLRLCMQGLMIDGIKRDRMPWAGDQALSTLANAFALGEGGVVADGLVALGRPEHGYVNGIADYSLWQVVNADLRLRCFGDEAFAQAEADRLDRFVADLAEHAGHDGVFRPAAQRGGFVDSGPGSVFLDWGLALEHGRDPVALQMLWYWALRSAERVLGRTRHPGADRWRALADALEATLRERAWLVRDGRWADYLDARESRRPARYANFLAVLAGMHDGVDVPPGVTDAIRVGVAGTPFMTAFRLRALLAAGEAPAVLEQVRATWGAMLERGPGTFWEEATIDDEPLAMYGRPFGRSLCHAWASGPAAILPEAVLGLRPIGDGWSRFAVQPELGDLAWASAVVPAPSGDIVVVADASTVTVQVPAGTVLVREGHSVPGPATVEWVRPPSAVLGGGTSGAAASGG